MEFIEIRYPDGGAYRLGAQEERDGWEPPEGLVIKRPSTPPKQPTQPAPAVSPLKKKKRARGKKKPKAKVSSDSDSSDAEGGGKHPKAAETDVLDRDIAALIFIRLPPKKVPATGRGKPAKTVQQDPLQSQLFNFNGTLDFVPLMRIISEQVTLVLHPEMFNLRPFVAGDINVQSLTWRFSVPKNGGPTVMGNSAGFEYFKTALRQDTKNRIVHFAVDLPKPPSSPAEVR